jgi:hypothetical protein
MQLNKYMKTRTSYVQVKKPDKKVKWRRSCFDKSVKNSIQTAGSPGEYKWRGKDGGFRRASHRGMIHLILPEDWGWGVEG